MNQRVQLVCAYTGYAFLALFLIGFAGLAGFVPPPSPADSAQKIANLFIDHTTSIRMGMIVGSFAGALTLPWQCAIAVQIRRLEGRASVLTYTWIAAAACFCIEFIYPFAFWMVTSFRPHEAPEMIRQFNDLSWLTLLGVVETAIVQAFVIGVAILRDTREQPLYPRWMGYFSMWAGTLFVPAGLIVFFKTGAFAWNGLVSWWIVLSIFALWIILLTVMTVKAINVPEDEPVDEVAALRDDVAALRAELESLRS